MSTKINFKFNLGDRISGNSITGRVGIVSRKEIKRKDIIQLKTLIFSQSAESVINPPITKLNKTSTKTVITEGLRGKKIYGEAEDYSKIIKVKKTGGHTQQQTTLKGHAMCRITIPIISQS